MITLDEVPTGYVGFRQKCIQIESRLAEANALSSISKAFTPNPPRTSAPTKIPTPATIPTSRARFTSLPAVSSLATGVNATPVVPVRTTTHSGDAMDMSKYHGRISDVEKQRRRKENLCLYCGEAGHYADFHRRGSLNIREVNADDEESGKEESLN